LHFMGDGSTAFDKHNLFIVPLLTGTSVAGPYLLEQFSGHFGHPINFGPLDFFAVKRLVLQALSQTEGTSWSRLAVVPPSVMDRLFKAIDDRALEVFADWLEELLLSLKRLGTLGAKLMDESLIADQQELLEEMQRFIAEQQLRLAQLERELPLEPRLDQGLVQELIASLRKVERQILKEIKRLKEVKERNVQCALLEAEGIASEQLEAELSSLNLNPKPDEELGELFESLKQLEVYHVTVQNKHPIERMLKLIAGRRTKPRQIGDVAWQFWSSVEDCGGHPMLLIKLCQYIRHDPISDEIMNSDLHNILGQATASLQRFVEAKYSRHFGSLAKRLTELSLTSVPLKLKTEIEFEVKEETTKEGKKESITMIKEASIQMISRTVGLPLLEHPVDPTSFRIELPVVFSSLCVGDFSQHLQFALGFPMLNRHPKHWENYIFGLHALRCDQFLRPSSQFKNRQLKILFPGAFVPSALADKIVGLPESAFPQDTSNGNRIGLKVSSTYRWCGKVKSKKGGEEKLPEWAVEYQRIDVHYVVCVGDFAKDLFNGKVLFADHPNHYLFDGQSMLFSADDEMSLDSSRNHLLLLWQAKYSSPNSEDIISKTDLATWYDQAQVVKSLMEKMWESNHSEKGTLEIVFVYVMNRNSSTSLNLQTIQNTENEIGQYVEKCKDLIVVTRKQMPTYFPAATHRLFLPVGQANSYYPRMFNDSEEKKITTSS